MNDKLASKIYTKQISITEWLQNIDFVNVDAFRMEDNDKRDRLAVVNQIINLPFDKATKFDIKEVQQMFGEFKNWFNQNQDKACAMRLIPLNPSLPKLRMRGPTVKEVVTNWYPKQNIDSQNYRVEFMFHPLQHNWSTIFVVNSRGVFGEVTKQMPSYLTQQIDGGEQVVNFSFDWQKWSLNHELLGAKKYLQNVIKYLKVEDTKKRQLLEEKLDSNFFNNYLAGYFETADSEFGTQFVDYNRILGKMYNDFVFTGNAVCSGIYTGKVRVVKNLPADDFVEGDILVCKMTTPDYINLMKKAGAIITETGGLLSHAAITARELKKPCLVGYNNATQIFKDGDVVEVDADKGVVKKIK